MTEQTREWVKYAEADYIAVERLFVNGSHPPYGIICFHCQQCIEKYIKAYLTEHDIEFPRTHWLTSLLDHVIPLKPEWDIHRNPLTILTNFAAETRYPGEGMPMSRKITQNAIEITQEIRTIIRTELNIK